jgi:thiamine pyrophosphate-dependent acetolactate synthase large subunit-like protein
MTIYKTHERIVELLQAEGVDTIFGIPDPSFFAMFIEAEARGMSVVSPHHEQGAALMADGYYRLAGKPAVLGINKGPGVANIAAGAAYLAKENIPAVFIMAQRQRFYEQRVRRGKMQYMSQPPLFEGSMKYIGTVEYPEQLDEVFHEAFRRALTGVPGPTMIELPLSVMQAQLDLPPAPPPTRYRLVGQEAGTGALAEAAKLLTEASQPIMLLGQGAFASRAHEDLVALAGKLACPIIATTAVEAVLKGMDERSFPYGTQAASDIVAKADVVLAIGSEIGEAMHYGRGNHWAKGKTDRKWIYVERDATAIGVNRPIDVPLVGDLTAVVPQLTRALGDLQRSLPADLDAWNTTRAAEKKELFDRIPATSSPIHTGRLAIEATKVLPEDYVLVRDGGASSMWFSALLQVTPRDAMWNSNYGAIGPGLPYAIGAQIADPSRRVVLLTGDSSFLFHISELETAARKQLPVVCIVAVDHAWGIEAASYKANFGANTPTPEARWTQQVRLDKTAESFGAHGEYVERAEDIGPAVQRALASGKPAVVHVEVDPEVNSSFAGIPGFTEFRTWYGEDGDFLGVPGQDGTKAEESGDSAPMTKGSGY